jgi:hypothetical protein
MEPVSPYLRAACRYAFKTRSRAGSSRDDQVSGFKGRFYGDNSLFLLFVILTKVLVRISIFETVASDKLRVAVCQSKSQ